LQRQINVQDQINIIYFSFLLHIASIYLIADIKNKSYIKNMYNQIFEIFFSVVTYLEFSLNSSTTAIRPAV